MHINIINYASWRYLRWAIALIVVCSGIYLSQHPTLPRNGGSWQGYVLGSVGLLLIIWLALLGVRKRSYHSGAMNLQAWVSAHIYLGLSLIAIASLHCAFQFGINVHTLAYILMCAVIISGVIGLYGYLRYPALLVENRSNQSFDERLDALEKINEEGLGIATQCDADIQTLIKSSVERSAIGGKMLDQFFARDTSTVSLPQSSGQAELLCSNKGQQAAIDFLVAKIPNTSKAGEAERLQKLLYVLGRRQEILRRLRRELSLQLRLKLWLGLHIPLTISLIAALSVHIFSVFFYW